MKIQLLLSLLIATFMLIPSKAQKFYEWDGSPTRVIGEKTIIEIPKEELGVMSIPVPDIITPLLNIGYKSLMKKLKDQEKKYLSEFAGSINFAKGFSLDSAKNVLTVNRIIIPTQKEKGAYKEESVFQLKLIPIKNTIENTIENPKDSTNNPKNSYAFKVGINQIKKSGAKVKRKYPFNDYTVTVTIKIKNKEGKLEEIKLPTLNFELIDLQSLQKGSGKIMGETTPFDYSTIYAIQVNVTEINAFKQQAARRAQWLSDNETDLNNLFKKLIEKLNKE